MLQALHGLFSERTDRRQAPPQQEHTDAEANVLDTIRNRDEIEIAEYSAILDRNACPVSEALDGLRVSLDDPRYEQYMPPNPECLHGDRCRCMWILVHKGEQAARVQ